MTDNIIYLFGKTELDDPLFSKILEGFSAHLQDGANFDETCRHYIGIGARAWVEKIGREQVRKNLLALVVALDDGGKA